MIGFHYPRIWMTLVSCCAIAASASASSLIPSQSSLGLDTVGYLNASHEASKGFQNSLSPQLVGKWNGFSEGPIFDAGTQADLLLIFSGAQDGSVRPSTYFELPELYVGTSKNLSAVSLHLGRKLEHWSHLDETWELGLWQPRFRWDYLHPENVGLTGAFLNVDLPYFHATAWGTPFFVPERGVPISETDGMLGSDSRWFVPPPSMISIFGKDTPVRYTLQLPEMRKLLLNWGVGVTARVGAEAGPWASAGYAFKPMNQLLLADDGDLQIREDKSDIRAEATVFPRVQYQRLVSLESGYASEPLNAWVSVLSESPLRDSTPATWTTQETRPALLVSTSVDFRIAGAPKRATRLDLSYLRGWGGNAGDQGPTSVVGVSSFEARYALLNAVALGVKSPLLSHFSGQSRFLYDIGHEGTVWSTELRYQAHSSWILGLGADLLTSEQDEDPENSDIIGRFRANDRVHAGVTYVF